MRAGRRVQQHEAAPAGGHDAVVRLLLEKHADISLQGGRYGIALQAVSAEGHEANVPLLLKKNADINAQGLGGRYGSALFFQLASDSAKA